MSSIPHCITSGYADTPEKERRCFVPLSPRAGQGQLLDFDFPYIPDVQFTIEVQNGDEFIIVDADIVFRCKVFHEFTEVIGVQFLPAVYKDIVSFSILVLILIFKPTGILGKKMVEKKT